MRRITLSFAAIVLVSGATALAQQPEFIHAQLTTKAADHGLQTEVAAAEGESSPLWLGYSVPVAEKFSTGWNSPRTTYLEGDHPYSAGDNIVTSNTSHDHAVLFLRIASHNIEKIHVDNPDRQVDAGGLRVVWLTHVSPEESVALFKALALQTGRNQLRDTAVFAIAIHQSPATIPALVSLAGPTNELSLREKGAFWLANQHGQEAFATIRHLVRNDPDPAFREKLAFDLTLVKDPDALKELVRMAHEDQSPQVRRQAQFWMAVAGGKSVAGDLRSQAENDPNSELRKSAVFAISRLPGDQATNQLIQLAGSSKDSEVRKQAVFWLGQSQDPRALDYLTKLLQP